MLLALAAGVVRDVFAHLLGRNEAVSCEAYRFILRKALVWKVSRYIQSASVQRSGGRIDILERERASDGGVQARPHREKAQGMPQSGII